MKFTEEQLEIMFIARILGTNRGQVFDDLAVPAAHRLSEAGWLERRRERNGDWSWWLTPQGDTALDLNLLRQSAAGRQN